MNKFVLSDKCQVKINRTSDETPVIIFEDLPVEQVVTNKNGVVISLDVDDDAMKEIINTLT